MAVCYREEYIIYNYVFGPFKKRNSYHKNVFHSKETFFTLPPKKHFLNRKKKLYLLEKTEFSFKQRNSHQNFFLSKEIKNDFLPK